MPGQDVRDALKAGIVVGASEGAHDAACNVSVRTTYRCILTVGVGNGDSLLRSQPSQ